MSKENESREFVNIKKIIKLCEKFFFCKIQKVITYLTKKEPGRIFPNRFYLTFIAVFIFPNLNNVSFKNIPIQKLQNFIEIGLLECFSFFF